MLFQCRLSQKVSEFEFLSSCFFSSRFVVRALVTGVARAVVVSADVVRNALIDSAEFG